MSATDLFWAYFLSQGMTVERFRLIGHTVLTPSIQADVIARGALKKFRTKQGKIFCSVHVCRIEVCFCGIWKWDVVLFEKGG